jgi:hypothetical protein
MVHVGTAADHEDVVSLDVMDFVRRSNIGLDSRLGEACSDSLRNAGRGTVTAGVGD